MEEEAELYEVEGQVAAHRDLLEQLMQGIDDSQDTVDALREQISETEIDLNHLRNEIAELQRVKKMRDIGGTVFTDCPDFEVERLNPEHQDHLNAVLDRIYSPGFSYKRAGVTVGDTGSSHLVQAALFEQEDERLKREKSSTLSDLMDSINSREENLLRLGAQRPGHYADGIRREHCSKLYSTDWNDLLEIH